MLKYSQLQSYPFTSEKDPGKVLDRVHDAYQSLSPEARTAIDTICDELVLSVKLRDPHTRFGPRAALELIGALLEKKFI